MTLFIVDAQLDANRARRVSGEPVVVLRDVHKSFGAQHVLDGISLTVAGVGKKSFCVWIIPHTFKITALRERKVGDAVNLEADLLGKYAEKFLPRRAVG